MGNDFGLADHDFWVWFKTLNMTEAEKVWYEATAEMYHAKRQEFYDAAKASIMVGVNKTKTKKFTMTHHQEAIRVAKGVFGQWQELYEYETVEYQGVPNPRHGLVKAWDEAEGYTPQAPEAAEDLTVLVEWLAAQTWSEFAVSLARQYQKKGELSPRQVEAAKSMMEKVESKKAARQETEAKADTGLDLSDLPSGMYAVPGGDTRLKVRVSRSRNESRTGRFPAGTIFVNDDAEYGARKLYGSQRPTESYRGDIAEALTAIAADPLAASMAYGQLVGSCGVCGRRLEDEASIAKGIGPICERKMAA